MDVVDEMNKPTKDHFVPQFYLSQFSCAEDENKVPALSNAGPFIISKNQSIGSIGFEYDIYTLSNEDIHIAVDKYLNPQFETPFTQSEAWELLSTGQEEKISDHHMLSLYLFVRHLQSRSPEKLRIMKACCTDALSASPLGEYTSEEISMYSAMAALPGGVTQHFLENVIDFDAYMSEYHNATMAIYKSPIPLRTSVFPVLTTSAEISSYISYWLPVSRYYGVLLLLSNGLFEFGGVRALDLQCARHYNRIFMTQLWRSVRVNHVIGDDEYLQEDMLWAGMTPEEGNPMKYRRPIMEAV